MNRNLANLALAIVLLSTQALGAEDDLTPVVSEGIVAAPVAEIWRIFTTDEGVKNLGVAKAKVDLRPGGMIWSAYDPAAELGSPQSIGTEILAIDPGRALATRIKQPPQGFPFTEAYKSVSSVITLSDLGDGRTHVRVAMYGYNHSEESQNMRKFFENGNAFVIKKLQTAYDSQVTRPGSVHDEAPLADLTFTQLVAAPREDVYRTFTTSAGWKSFFRNVDSKIGALPGEPMEIYFSTANPPGQQGSEGCKILSIVPNELFTFTWNSPPTTPIARQHQTWVVVEFGEVSPKLTKVTLRHLGFDKAAASTPGSEAEFRTARGHFVAAWPKVMSALAKHFEQK